MFPESKITEIYYMADDLSLKLQRFIIWPMIFARNLLCNRKNI